MGLLAGFRTRGLTFTGGARLRVLGPASVIAQCSDSLKKQRDELLAELQDEAEEVILTWPIGYRLWLLQTIGFCLSRGDTKADSFWTAYRDIKAQLAEQIALPDAMTAAWLAPDSDGTVIDAPETTARQNTADGNGSREGNAW